MHLQFLSLGHQPTDCDTFTVTNISNTLKQISSTELEPLSFLSSSYRKIYSTWPVIMECSGAVTQGWVPSLVVPLVWGTTGLKSSRAAAALSTCEYPRHFQMSNSLLVQNTLYNIIQLLCFFSPLPFTTAPVIQISVALIVM